MANLSRRLNARVCPRIWKDEKFEQLAPTDKLVTLYILTGPHWNTAGLFKISVGELAEDLGIDPAQSRIAVARVCECFDWKFDSHTRMIYLPKWFFYNPIRSAKHARGTGEIVASLGRGPCQTAFRRNREFIHPEFWKELTKVLNVEIEFSTDIEKREERRKKVKPPSEVLSSSKAGPGSGYVFPVRGKKGGKAAREWELPQSELELYREAYPDLEVDRQIENAVRWCEHNGSRRKTPGGMLSFLTRWLSSEQNRPRPGKDTVKVFGNQFSADDPNRPLLAGELQNIPSVEELNERWRKDENDV